MYEPHINNLTALFKGKREKSKEYLISAIQKDPYNLTRELLRAPDKAWPYVSEIIRANPKGVFLAILGFQPGGRAERFLTEIGAGKYIPRIREFWKEISSANSYRNTGIPLDYEQIHREFLSGNVEKALKEINELNTTGRKLDVMLSRWNELKTLAQKAGEEIPDIMPAIKKLDVDGAQKVLNSIDEELLRAIPISSSPRQSRKYIRFPSSKQWEQGCPPSGFIPSASATPSKMEKPASSPARIKPPSPRR